MNEGLTALVLVFPFVLMFLFLAYYAVKAAIAKWFKPPTT
jgi:hypothetical protein